MPDTSDDMLDAMVAELVARHGVHTVILYGSRARDEHTDASDFDLLGVRETGETVLDGRRFGDELLDAVIHCEADFATLADELIRIRSGRVLLQKGDFGDQLVARAAELFERGPKPVDASEREHIRTWITKTLARVARAGSGGFGRIEEVEAAYRRVWLLTEILEAYFKLRSRWYLGPKESFAWIGLNDPTALTLFEDALRPEASRVALRRLAEHVITSAS